jgi:hypothetical protein
MKSQNSKTPKENKLMDEFILSIFYDIDNFCKKFIPYLEQQCLTMDNSGQIWNCQVL